MGDAMIPLRVAVLKAKKGECTALKNLDDSTNSKILPLFEVGAMTAAILELKYISASTTPVMTYLNHVLDAVVGAWQGRPAMVDCYQWAHNARVENGDHVVAYAVSRLQADGVPVVPVIGYDRWESVEYRFGMSSIPVPRDGHYCLRLDHFAIEDSAEPDVFARTVGDIIEELVLEPQKCSVLLDFADISMDVASIEATAAKASDMIRQLEVFGFKYFIICGCSLPGSIDLAVSDRDSQGFVLRKEMLIWKMLREEFPGLAIVGGDYGVRGPTTKEIRSKYTNGKIRYSVRDQEFVVRGHPFLDDHDHLQMYGLAEAVVTSPHFLSGDFSWGDAQILLGSHRGGALDLSRWIAIDTNHHLTFVVQEVEEFERQLVTRVHSLV